MKIGELTERLLDLPESRWNDAFEANDDTNRFLLVEELAQLAVWSAYASLYFSYRFEGWTHEDSVKFASKSIKKIKEILGYSLPKDIKK